MVIPNPEPLITPFIVRLLPVFVTVIPLELANVILPLIALLVSVLLSTKAFAPFNVNAFAIAKLLPFKIIEAPLLTPALPVPKDTELLMVILPALILVPPL